MQLDIPSGSFAAVIFDLDGTLADTMPLHHRAWQQQLALHDCPFPESLFYSLGGIPARGVVQRLNEAYDLAMDPQAVATAKEQRYLDLLDTVEPIPAVRDFMLDQHNQRPLAVATGSLRDIAARTLEALGLTHYFDAIVCAEDYEHGKPAPDVFLITAERLGVVPEQCLVFEDAGPGLEAARAAGMTVVHVPSHPTPSSP